MNTLSWFLLFVDIFENIRIISGTSVTIGLVAGGIGTFITFLCYGDLSARDFPEGTSKGSHSYQIYMRIRRLSYTAWMIVIISGIFLTFTPKKATIYKIAVSEFGEEVIKNPEVQEVFGDLKEVIKNELKEMKKQGK